MYNYFVVVNDPENKDTVHAELQSATGSNTIPARQVECTDDMPGSLYNGLFMLTDEEATTLKTDPRIWDVHRIPSEVGIQQGHHGSRSGQFDRSAISVTSAMRNWALSRCIHTTDNFAGSTSTTTAYTFNLDGTGVDVVILDTGVEAGHPEFAVNADGTGGSRVQNYDWTVHGFLSTPTGGFLGDGDGHGSNVASIIAGNTCGWAPGANIYTLRAVGNSGIDITTGATLGTFDDALAWQTIRAFHLAKPITSTGYRRPTVVNASYGYYANYRAMSLINYRGTVHYVSTTSGLYGTIGLNEGGDGTHNTRVASIDADVLACINAGVVVCCSAGNDAHKADLPTGLDYNNYWVDTNNYGYYYQQGASPGATPGVICTGAVSQTTGSATPEHKISFSTTGPRVDIFAPGGYIMGAYANSAYTGNNAVQDPRNSSYYLQKISGTSQASPNVAGIVACLLQARPWMTATNVLNFLNSVSLKNELNEFYYALQGGSYTYISTGTYTNLSSLQGAVNGYLYMPFNLPTPLTIS
jgi:subtilisin family serine protease